MATIVAAFATLWDTPDVADLISAPDNTGHRPVEIPAIAFELHLIKGDPITARTDPFGIAAAFKIHIPEAEIMRFIADCPAASSDRAAFGLAVTIIIVTMTVMTVTIAGRIPDRCIPLRADAKMERAISGLNRDTARDVFA